jgi:hypothetical protein
MTISIPQPFATYQELVAAENTREALIRRWGRCGISEHDKLELYKLEARIKITNVNNFKQPPHEQGTIS